MLHAISHCRTGETEPFDTLLLDSIDRHLRRKLLTTAGGLKVMVDLPEAVLLADGDRLVLDDGRAIAITAAKEELYLVKAGTVALRHLAWHLGNRHLAAQIDEDRILIRRDHVIRAMLEGLGATVTEVVECFQPLRGAYHGHGGHDHGHHHHHDDHDHHDHAHGSDGHSHARGPGTDA